MNNLFDLEFLKIENQKLRNYISLILSEIEFTQRVDEIKLNFTKLTDSEHIIAPILDRISKIQSEKKLLEQELHLN